MCSDHFTEGCFKINGQRRCLKVGAVPSISNFGRKKIERASRTSRWLRVAPSSRPPVLSEEATSETTHDVDLDRTWSDSSTVRMETETNSIELQSTSAPMDVQQTSSSTQTNLTSDDISFFESLAQESVKLKRKIQAERMKSFRLRKKITNLQEALTDLQEQSVISHNLVDQLLETGGPDMLSLIENELRNSSRNSGSIRYTDEVKQFAMTVYFHSPAAYRYLRTCFTLPHERTLVGWLAHIDGFTDAAFQLLKTKLDKDEIEPECVLIIDSMALRKQRVYSHQEGRNLGYVDIGTGEDRSKLAGEALVFLIKGLKTKWRYPIGYFLVGKFTL